MTIKSDEKFLGVEPSLEDYWRSIILLGRNTASYKFSLAKTLLEIPNKKNLILIEDIALPFALNICQHLKKYDKQHTGFSNTFLDDCRKFNSQKISENDLVTSSIKNGFTYVFDAFHNVIGSQTPFFFRDAGKRDRSIILTDNFYSLLENNSNKNFLYEIDSRWRLWELAISLKINPKLIEIKSDTNDEILFILNQKNKRVDVTSVKPTLNGYQKGKCFYCACNIEVEACETDHFFPDTLKEHSKDIGYNFYKVDEIWNLVLTCVDCNRGPGGKFHKIPELNFLNLLKIRNNHYIESHHPLRETIMNQIGNTFSSREKFLNEFYSQSIRVIPFKWKPKTFK